MAETWPRVIQSSRHVAEALDWVRWKSQDRVRLVVAVGINCVAVAKPREVSAEDAIAILQDVQAQIARTIHQLDQRKQTHISTPLPDR